MNPNYTYNAKEDDPPAMKRKVVRGGSWNNYAFNTQSSYRTHGALYVRYYVRGFRIIRTLPKKGVS